MRLAARQRDPVPSRTRRDHPPSGDDLGDHGGLTRGSRLVTRRLQLHPDRRQAVWR